MKVEFVAYEIADVDAEKVLIAKILSSYQRTTIKDHYYELHTKQPKMPRSSTRHSLKKLRIFT